MTQWWNAWVDASWVDQGSFAIAVIFLVVQKFRGTINFKSRRQVLEAFMNGFAIFPLLVLFGSFFSSRLVSSLASASRITLLFSSVAALYAVIRDPGDSLLGPGSTSLPSPQPLPAPKQKN